MVITEELVSIIMSTYNEKIEWIDLSVNSILNQTHSNLEFIIVLDKPENIELKNTLETYAQKDSRIKLILNDENMGLVNSLNQALKYSKGDYILRMDADDISIPNRIEIQLRYMKEKKLDFLFTPVLYINEIGDELFKSNEEEYTSEEVKLLLSIFNISNHPTWLCKKEVYNTLSGYRNIRHNEDYDFSLRALTEGYKIGKMPKYVLEYRVRDNGVSQSNLYEQYLIAKELSKYFKKNKLNSFDQLQININKITKNVTEDKCEKFNAMNGYFSNSIKLIKNRKYFKAFIMIIMSVKTSKYAVIKYFDLFRINIK